MVVREASTERSTAAASQSGECVNLTDTHQVAEDVEGEQDGSRYVLENVVTAVFPQNLELKKKFSTLRWQAMLKLAN